MLPKEGDRVVVFNLKQRDVSSGYNAKYAIKMINAFNMDTRYHLIYTIHNVLSTMKTVKAVLYCLLTGIPLLT